MANFVDEVESGDRVRGLKALRTMTTDPKDLAALSL
jgi:hypothetical protein